MWACKKKFLLCPRSEPANRIQTGLLDFPSVGNLGLPRNPLSSCGVTRPNKTHFFIYVVLAVFKKALSSSFEHGRHSLYHDWMYDTYFVPRIGRWKKEFYLPAQDFSLLAIISVCIASSDKFYELFGRRSRVLSVLVQHNVRLFPTFCCHGIEDAKRWSSVHLVLLLCEFKPPARGILP